MAILFKNATILPMTVNEAEEKELTLKGAVGVVGNTIALVSEKESEIEEFRNNNMGNLEEIDLKGKVLMPGLVNTHAHISMTLLRGYSDDKELMAWLNEDVWPFEACMSGDHIAVGAKLGVAEMLLGGTTSFVDMYWQEHRVAEVARDMGIRGIVGCTLLDQNVSTIEQDIVKALEVTKGNSRVEVAVAPHSAYTCSPETLRFAVELTKKYNIPMTTHIAETRDEMKILEDRYSKTPVEIFSEAGALNSRLVAAHCLYLNSGDKEMMRDNGVAVAHNPQSNMKLASGIAPVSEYINEGLLCAIGTDGPCSNNDLDMWEEMRTASFLQKSSTSNPCSLTAYETLQLATVNGAMALGYGDTLGVVKAGALADLIVVDIYKPHLQPMHNLAANLVYSAKASDVEMVMVNGRILVRDSRVCGLDYEGLFGEVDGAIGEIMAKRSESSEL